MQSDVRFMFERFTQEAIKTIMLAQEEARRLGWNHVSTDKILLGLFGTKGIAKQALTSCGATKERARLEVENVTGRGSEPPNVEIPFTLRAKNVLEQAWAAAGRSSYEIGPEHLLLGIIRDASEKPEEGNEDSAGRALDRMGINLETLKAKVYELIEAKPA